jgi:hypothetical protein
MKHHPDGTIEYKAHLVIKSHEQTDFGESYAPVGQLTTFRYLYSLVGKNGWNIDHLDVVTAFSNPEVDDDDICRTLSDGRPEGLNAPMIVIRLTKALYGLKQAPRLWHNNINTFLPSPEFKRCMADSNLYLRSDGILMLLYFGDISMLYLEDATKAAIEVKARLSEKCTITNPGPACTFLGIEIHRKENGTGPGTAISLDQKAFINTIHKRFNMQNAHGASTLMNPNVQLDLAEDWEEQELKDIKGYQAILSSLMYVALATPPDISFAVAVLCQYNLSSFTSHLTTAKRVLKYLKSTADFPLHFSSSSTRSNDQLTAYTDSDWATDSADLKSPVGHVFLLSNGAGSWKSQKQDIIAMSTLKAEYIACSEGSREAKWLLQLHKIYTTKTHLRSQSIVTIRMHLVISQLGLYRLAQSISTFAITMVEISLPAR